MSASGGMASSVAGSVLTVATISDLRGRRGPGWLTVGRSNAGLIVGACRGSGPVWLSLPGPVFGARLLTAFVRGGGFGAGDLWRRGTSGAGRDVPGVLRAVGWTALVGAGPALVALGQGQTAFRYVPAIAIGTAMTFLVSR